MSEGEKWSKIDNSFERLTRELELVGKRKITREKILEKIRESIATERRIVKESFGGAFH